jgi:hypothetical protein
MIQHFPRVFYRPVLPACVLEISYVLFLFAVNGDDGDSSIQEHICLPVDEFELCIPVRMLFPKLHGFLV